MGRIFVITVIVFAAFISCNCFGQIKYLTHCYQGHIYTQEGQPISGLKIIPQYWSGESEKAPIVFTDENGYFILEMASNTEISISNTLYVEYEGKIIDSINVARFGPHKREFRYFVSGYADTLFIDLNGEKRSFERCSSRR